MPMDVEQAYRCGKCGICMATCPVYGEVRDETGSPRAKLQLIRHFAEADLASSPRLQEIMSRCLMCGACTANCPSGVEHPGLFMQMRARLAADHGVSWPKRVLFHLLTHEERLRLAARFASLGYHRVLARLERDVRLGRVRLSRVPSFNRRPFSTQVPNELAPLGPEQGQVVYFYGCGTEYLYAEVGHATVAVLRRLGFRVFIPKDQVCCGLPMFVGGSPAGSRGNILSNLDALGRRPAATVVCDCATCGSALQAEYARVLALLGDNDRRARELAARTRDVTAFVLEHLERLAPRFQRHTPPRRVTYHSPCHLRHFQGVESAVETLLRNLPGIDYVRAADFNACCGGGGTFSLDYPEIAGRIVRRKISNARATGAELWASGCPGCRLALAGGQESGDPIRLCHPIQLVAAATEP